MDEKTGNFSEWGNKIVTNTPMGKFGNAQFIKSNQRSCNMAYEGPEVPQGNPWGYRHQFNIAESGFGTRGPRVQNDRAGEVERTLNVKDFDLKRKRQSEKITFDNRS